MYCSRRVSQEMCTVSLNCESCVWNKNASQPRGCGLMSQLQTEPNMTLNLAWLWEQIGSLVKHCYFINTFFLSAFLDVGSWREGGGRNLNTASSTPEMDAKAQEEDLTTSTPPAEPEEPGRNITTEGQQEKKESRERLPPSVHPQPKVNGGQQPPSGVPTHFDPAFRSMMPPYVSYILILKMEDKGLRCN